MTEQATTLAEVMPKMAAAVLHSSSAQGDLMRHGRLPPKQKGGETAAEIIQPLAISTAIYDGLAILYNEAEVGAMLVVSLPHRPVMGNLHRVLKGRGLLMGIDYLAYRAKFDVDGNRYPVKDRPLVLERLTETLMKVSVGRPGLGREIAAAAREQGEASPELTHAKIRTDPPKREQRRAERLQRLLQEEADVGLGTLLSGAPMLATSGSLDEQESRALEEMEIPVPRTGG